MIRQPPLRSCFYICFLVIKCTPNIMKEGISERVLTKYLKVNVSLSGSSYFVIGSTSISSCVESIHSSYRISMAIGTRNVALWQSLILKVAKALYNSFVILLPPLNQRDLMGLCIFLGIFVKLRVRMYYTGHLSVIDIVPFVLVVSSSQLSVKALESPIKNSSCSIK